MAKKRKFQVDPEPKPDLTPMIDIVFNLLIFFMTGFPVRRHRKLLALIVVLILTHI